MVDVTLVDFLKRRITMLEAAAGKMSWTLTGGEPAVWYSSLKMPDGTHLIASRWQRADGEWREDLVGFVTEGWRTLVAANDPAAVMAQCRAYRALIDLYEAHSHEADAEHRWTGFGGGYATATEHALRALATAWADDPDFQEEWRLDQPQ